MRGRVTGAEAGDVMVTKGLVGHCESFSLFLVTWGATIRL